MSGQWKEVARLRFRGERFRDHALDLLALTELQHFQQIVAETAKALWRAAHPDRERLPRHFEERTRLCLRRIEEGSATVPLEVYLELPEQAEFWDPEPVEVNRAVGLAYDVLRSMADGSELPSDLPNDLVPRFAEWGQSLAQEEEIDLQPPDPRPPARLNRTVRERLQSFAEKPRASRVEITGECLEADVRQRRFQVWRDPQTNVQASFDDAQEDLVTSALKQHRSVRIRVRGTADVSPQGKPLRFLTVDSLELVGPQDDAIDFGAPAVEDELRAVWADVPEKEWSKLPADLTENLDHYIYDTPK